MARSSPYNPIQTIVQNRPRHATSVFSQRLNSVSYASIEAGNRESTFDSDFYHFIAGLKGEFAKDYFWEIGYVFDEQDLTRTDTGDQRFSLLMPAVANGSFNPFVGLNAPRQPAQKLSKLVVDLNIAFRSLLQHGRRTLFLGSAIGGRAFTGLPQGA